MICFLFVVCLFGVAASYTLSQSISRPIWQLMSFMQKAESGDLTTRYWGNRQDEVGMLGRSFNRMLLQIRKLMKLSELRERQKREAELRSLQAHIKPHFLYNTLDTIHWMARKKGADDVSDLVESLSRLFRIGLSKGMISFPCPTNGRISAVTCKYRKRVTATGCRSRWSFRLRLRNCMC